jgi:hypothetical protein
MTPATLQRQHAKGLISDALKADIEANGHVITPALQARLNDEVTVAMRATHPKRSTLGQITHATKSTIQTQLLRQHRTTDDEYRARLDTCKACPSGVVQLTRDGEPWTCGTMLKESREAGRKTCGCVLTAKAIDRREACPNGYWPTLKPSAE